MRIPMLLMLGLICATSSVQAESNCTQRLISKRLKNSIQVGSPINETRSVTIETDSKRMISCSSLPVGYAPQVLRHFKRLDAPNPLSVDELIGFLHSPWAPLSISAGRELIRIAKYDQPPFQKQQLERLTEGVLTSQLAPVSTQLTIRLLSLQNETQATTYLSQLLLSSANLSVQRAAARLLGRLSSEAARVALTKCTKEKNRLLSSRCARSLVRWRTQRDTLTPYPRDE